LLVRARHQIEISLRRFGLTDLNVSEFGLGCARIGGIFKTEPAEFTRILSTAFDAGINFFDTADMYSQGESETFLGRTFRRQRDKVVLSSKAGYVLPSQRRLVARLKPIVRPIIGALKISRSQLPGAVRGSLAQDFSPAYLRRALESSLKRLQTDYLDIFQLHSPPQEVVEPAEWVHTLESFKQEGKIRYFGVSCDEVDATFTALKHGGLSSIQLPLNLLERAALPALPIARAGGLGVIVRESLANGLLIKTLTLEQIREYCQSDQEAAAKAARIEAYRRLAAENGNTLTQLALQFVTSLEGVSVTLVGVSRLEQLQSLIETGLPADSRPGPPAVPDLV